MNVVPVSLREAHAFVRAHHRHHKPSRGGKFAIGVSDGDRIVGVVVVGRPKARMIQDAWTAEVTRCCTDGTRNACSLLYAAAWRAARAMGYRRLVTYTLPEEGGASLRGAGWRLLNERAGGGSWGRKDRPRVDEHPTQEKLRWADRRSVSEPTAQPLREALEQIRALVMVQGDGFFPDSMSYLQPDHYHARVRAIARAALDAAPAVTVPARPPLTHERLYLIAAETAEALGVPDATDAVAVILNARLARWIAAERARKNAPTQAEPT